MWLDGHVHLCVCWLCMSLFGPMTSKRLARGWQGCEVANLEDSYHMVVRENRIGGVS
ncbi:hypothetical protein KP509_11G049500 [Ceratopteris richardii]|uniref:Uncharacterized protein n=1 Tax=Ceratopteris richardii TaxID=49495 RepID=A0A8T2TSR9_CERRI|nr:hypothetical protein KP509_11G049500 [Ceratopteris richardii]